jgi:N utilization substance protein A
LLAVLHGAGYNLLNDVLDLEREDTLKIPGMTPELAENLMAFLADLAEDEAGTEAKAETPPAEAAQPEAPPAG